MGEKDFVCFLVDETLKLQQSGESELSSLDLKLRDYGMEFLKGEFLPQAQVLRFHAKFGDLDVPINWSVFSTEHNHAEGILLDAENDEDHFFHVMRVAWNPNFVRLLIIHDAGFCYLVGVKKGEEAHLRDVMNPQEWLKSAA